MHCTQCSQQLHYQLFAKYHSANMFCQKLVANFNYTKILSKSLLFDYCFANSHLKRLLSTQLINDGRVLVVQESEFTRGAMQFPTSWLRDNCQCNECFHHATQSRIINWERCNSIGVRAATITANDEKNAIIIDWQDAHKSEYNLQWLRMRDFCPDNRKRYTEEFYKPKEIVWGKREFSDILKFYDFQKIIANDIDLYKWLQALAVYGVAIIQNAPHDASVARQLSERIGFIRRTTYGELFEVKSKEEAHNYAYLTTPLPLHVDIPYYEHIPGINILHCLVQSESKGGENLLTDGFYVADQLRQHYPKYFDILLKTPVDWNDIGKDSGLEFHNIWRTPVINLDIDGRYHRINHNTTKRDSHFTVPIELVDAWYEANDRFLQMSYEAAVQFKTAPGDVFVFNNRRMLHGRTSFEDSAQNKRHLIGAYVDWDIIYSKMRVLKTKLKC